MSLATYVAMKSSSCSMMAITFFNVNFSSMYSRMILSWCFSQIVTCIKPALDGCITRPAAGIEAILSDSVMVDSSEIRRYGDMSLVRLQKYKASSVESPFGVDLTCQNI